LLPSWFSDKEGMVEEIKKEQRRYPRREFKAHAGLLVEGKYSLCRTWDIGEGGIAMISPVKLEPGQKILVSFQIPSGDVSRGDFVSLRGVILSSRAIESQHFYGVQFLDLPFVNKRQIRAFVASKKFQ
jgi:c-di-GMP-binding flagellar brake protein YcgR